MHDQAHVIAAILEDPAPHAGRSYTLTGPEEMDHYQIAAVFSSNLGREITYEPVAFEEFAQVLRASGLTDHLVQHPREVSLDYQDGVFARTNNVVRTIGLTTPTTVMDFAEQNRALYTKHG